MRRRSGSRPRRALAVIVLALVASACPGEPADPPPTPGASGPSAEPRRGGEVVVAYPHEPATLDPFTPAGRAPATRDLTRLVMPALYRLGPAGSRERWLLAAEPRVTETPRFTVALSLREDAVWSDGTPITIEDLRATWRHVMERDAASRRGYDMIRRIVADGPKAGRIEFRARYEGWRDLFGAGLGVLPAHVVADDADAFARAWPVSGGPFVLARWRRGLDVIFEPNPRAWGDDAPSIDRLRVAFTPDAIGALELFRRGDVDVLGPYHAPDWQRRVAEATDATISAETGTTAAVLLIRTDVQPFTQPAVRRALAYAIDRARLVRGVVATEGAALDGVDDDDRSFARYREDLARARDELREAGWTGDPPSRGGAPLEGTIAFDGDDLGGVMLRAIQFQALRAGFDLQGVALETEEFWGEWLDGPDMTVAIVVVREPSLLALLDDAERRALEDRPARVAGSVPFLPLYLVSVGTAASARVTGVCASAAADGPFWNAHSWRVDAAQQAPACPSLVAAAA